ncbi:A disintegrin and metalloproteinase with thrombospondin motifs 7-like isoform X2 [Copidosoma floridanum]|uniref:A disintegrin and metalloproteinase with thrombospondin motifs 7-like isoform X2 n=1 Tax=Copidosoma floridanum TaxID=29053 RepID=UPI0006C94B2E|nr:A disintegrin and metalloproteinase with thrombospondin motifs 7-like isoform X2 [Copidosoma floridanum]
MKQKMMSFCTASEKVTSCRQKMHLLVLLLSISVIHAVQDDVPTRPKGLYTGEDHIHSHEIVYPRKVTHLGELISRNVTHHHDGDAAVVNDAKTKEVHYRLAMDGDREYHLQLTPVREFIGSGMVVERRKRDLHKREPAKRHASTCHYRGVIRDQPDSKVVLSACDGLAGFLHGEHGEAWLEPVAREHEHRYRDSAAMLGHESSRPHLLFRRARESKLQVSERQQEHRKPTLKDTKGDGGAAEGSSGRRKPRRKKKKKHERTCGTREPRRLTETLLEWQTQPGLVQVQGRGRRRQLTRQQHLPGHHWQRSKRSVSRPRHVEALVVADTTMMAFHQDGDVETYLLTIMNMVSALYLDPTIGNFINVVVVRIILMEEDEAEGLNITINADKTLYNFCKWQLKLNPSDDSHPNHHDVAILVTREDICSRANTPCSTLGVAHVAGMCQSDRSCSVNEDNGITLAHTITHELGHNFGMYHDTEKIGCSKKEGDKLHVMTPSFEADTVGVAWSKCSRRDITNFLDQGKGECLEDEPADNDYAYPDLPPGAMYNAEHQCRLQFAVREASVCSPLEEICSKLWCVVDGVCTTMLHPAAPGTHCGKHMWCQNQECVPIVDRPNPVDGSWGEWGSWSECSRSCGAGVSIIERKCDQPEPANGGKFCIGKRRRYKICNTQACPEGVPSFRSVQCSAYNGKEYKGKNYTWLPYFDQTEPCELYCTDTEESVIVPWGDAALDGTPCNVGTRDMCIAGICRKVGCDWAVDSDATEDQCGICHGDGTQCVTIRGSYDKNEGPGYREVVVIPEGSRNIKIEEVGNSKNYIGIGRPDLDEYFLNGKRQITLAGEYQVAGTPALYERDHDKEKVRIPGPIKEDIVVYLIYRGHYRNFGLRYEYTVPKRESGRVPEYSWAYSDWSLCSVTCGGGTQISHALCHESRSGVVEDKFCSGTKKPEAMSRECNAKPCPARWWTGPWQACPVICGEGALRKRSVMCVAASRGEDQPELALPDQDCDKDARPEEVEPCPELPVCEPSSEAPLIVYADEKSAAFYNVSEPAGSTTLDGLGSTEVEPEILEFDNVVDVDNPEESSKYNAKPKWQVSKWSYCSAGRKTRKVFCSVAVDSEACGLENKPADTEECRAGKWVTGKWSACNATCSAKSGQKRRDVTCHDRQTNLASADCNPERKPLEVRRCHHKKPCPDEKIGCKDSIDPSWICSSYRPMCDASPIVREKCCATCLKRRKHVRHNRRQGVVN